MNPNLTTHLTIAGMTCGSCARRVQRILLTHPEVLAADVQLRAQEATVTHGAPLDLAPIVRELAEHGYAAALAADSPTSR